MQVWTRTHGTMRRVTEISSAISVALLAAVGCSESSAESAIPCTVEAVLEAKCLRCHGEPTQLGAPYSFSDLSRIREVRGDKPVYERIAAALRVDFMPPLDVEAEPAVQPLSAREKRVLLEWVNEGAPSVKRGACD